jgi:hypothetical protein
MPIYLNHDQKMDMSRAFVVDAYVFVCVEQRQKPYLLETSIDSWDLQQISGLNASSLQPSC